MPLQYHELDYPSGDVTSFLETEFDPSDVQQAQEIATLIIIQNPKLMTEVTEWRWQMELERGTIHFDPNDPQNYLIQEIGPFLKRIIRDRMVPATEKLSEAHTPVFNPFEIKFSNFDYTMAPEEQKLYHLSLNSGNFEVFASNSPLTYAPHTLLVSSESKPQFLSERDLYAVAEISLSHPDYSFIYSSMGAGAGVNHQHWHMIAGKEHYPVSDHKMKPIEGIKSGHVQVSELPDWPTDSLIVSGDPIACTDFTIDIIRLLQSQNSPHNLLYSDGQFWINPRSRKITNVLPGKKYGSWETILGICNCCSWEEYFSATTDTFNQALNEIKLDNEEREQFKQRVIELSNNY